MFAKNDKANLTRAGADALTVVARQIIATHGVRHGKKAFDAIVSGLLDALAYAEGDESRGVAHKPAVTVDVAATRKKQGLSRPKFARKFGLDARAVQDWEQAWRQPDRAARVLLKVIEKEPDAVVRALADGDPG